MESKRLNDAQLAIDAIIRGLELDQISFAYDGVLPRAVSAAHASFRPVFKSGAVTSTTANLPSAFMLSHLTFQLG